MTFFLKINFLLTLFIIGSNLFSNEIAFNNYGDDLSLRNNEEFREFITQAVINQPDFKEIIAMKSKYNFDYRVSRADRFPTISSSIINENYFDRKISEVDSIRKIQDDSLDAVVEINQQLYAGNRINNKILNAKRQIEIGNLELEERTSELLLKANQIYFDTFKFYVIKKYLNDQATKLEKLLELSDKRLQAGIAQPAERALLQIKYNELLITRANINSEIISSRETYFRFFDEEFALKMVPTVLLSNLDANSNLLNDNNINSLSYGVQISDIVFDQSKTEINIVRGEYRPEFGLNVKYIQYDFDRDFDEFDVRGGIYFQMPIFDFGRRGNKINSAKANSSQLRWENQSEKRDFLIEKKSLEGKLVALNLMLEELKNTQVNTRKQQKILSQRMTGSEYNSVALADVIVQDINLFVEVLDTEISLYLTDLQLSHVKTELLSRFKLAL